MSFREKTAWISVVSMLAIYGLYFGTLVHAGPQSGAAGTGGLLETVVALALVQAGLTAAVAIAAPRDAKAPRDERDKLIEHRAAQVAYAALATSIASVCFFGGFDPPIVFDANALLFILVAAEVLRSSCRIVQYRRGV